MAANQEDRWQDLRFLLERPGNLVGANFTPCPELLEFIQSDACRVLCVGAGGLGCELLKDLALTGFAHIDVIDMDTIDVSNLNRQFLFRTKDVGKSKAEVAAARVNERVQGVTVVAHHGRIEDKPLEFYKGFTVIILGLDSLEARRYMNQIACSLLEYDEEGKPDPSTIKPLVDGGTEGFAGHARVILPGMNPCFDCTLWLFPPQVKFPLCTLAETPRSAAHCIEYAHLVQWDKERSGESFDADNEEHMQWVFKNAVARANEFGIPGVTLPYTQGVVKNIIPAVASTNAIVAASCVLEALKLVTAASTGMDNYLMYVGTDSIYTHTVRYERDDACLVCSPGVPLHTDLSTTLQAFLDSLVADERFKESVTQPALYMGDTPLFAGGIYASDTKPNLARTLQELGVGHGTVLTVNDKKLNHPIRLRVTAQ